MGRGPEILANLLRHPGGCWGVVTWSCAARTRHVSDLFLAGGAGWLLAAAMQDLDCRMLTERTVFIKCVFLSSTIPCTVQLYLYRTVLCVRGYSYMYCTVLTVQVQYAADYSIDPVIVHSRDRRVQ